MEDKKAEDIILIDLQGIAIFTDYFVICSGNSERMIRSLVKAADETMQVKHKVKGKNIGSPSNGWTAVDYGSIVLHIFSPQQRSYYQLEELWSSGKMLLRVK